MLLAETNLLWRRLVIVAVVVLIVTAIVARWSTARSRRDLPPEATRYRVLRRSIAPIAVGVLSALLVIPAVRAVAGGILASSAVIGSSSASPAADARELRRGHPDRVHPAAAARRRGPDRRAARASSRRSASRTRSSARRGQPARRPEREAGLGYHPERHDPEPGKVAEITVQVPLATDLGAASTRSAAGRGARTDVFVRTSPAARRSRCAPAPTTPTPSELERELRLRVHGALRAEGVYA